jgi:hypothetical protein
MLYTYSHRSGNFFIKTHFSSRSVLIGEVKFPSNIRTVQLDENDRKSKKQEKREKECRLVPCRLLSEADDDDSLSIFLSVAFTVEITVSIPSLFSVALPASWCHNFGRAKNRPSKGFQ